MSDTGSVLDRNEAQPSLQSMDQIKYVTGPGRGPEVQWSYADGNSRLVEITLEVFKELIHFSFG